MQFDNSVALRDTQNDKQIYKLTAVCLCINYEYSSWKIEKENMKNTKKIINFSKKKRGDVKSANCVVGVNVWTCVCFLPGCVWPSTRG